MSARKSNGRCQLQLLTLDDRNLPAAIVMPAWEFSTLQGIDNILTYVPAIESAGTPLHLPDLWTCEYDPLRDDRTQICPVVATPQVVESIADIVIDHWAATGLNPDQVADLRSVQLQIGDLGPGCLSVSYQDNHIIVVDDDASGWGWVTDDLAANALGDRTKLGRMDLFTALMHEYGHMLGHENEGMSGGVMNNSLGPLRRIDFGSDGQPVFSRLHHLFAPIMIPDEPDPVEQLDPLLSAWDPTEDGRAEDDCLAEQWENEMSGSSEWSGVDELRPLDEIDGPDQADPLSGADNAVSDELIDAALGIGEDDLS